VILGQVASAEGYRLESSDELGSTNDEAMARARAGDPGKSWFVATVQTKGRGRLGRVWRSPPGNLYASLLLIDASPPALSAQLGFVAGVALAGALKVLLRDASRLRLKWPNDALFDGAKLSGLLLEGASVPNGSFACIVGFGVNCLSSPKDLPYSTVCLRDIGAVSADRGDLFALLSDGMAHWIKVWDRGAGFARVREAWLALAGGLGETIRVSQGATSRQGLFRGIDAQGRLLLDIGAGAPLVIEAGDVTLSQQRLA
jgi:BirA family transcriptional regulator, biotin operon repressor / biotin---[acetyl-CoA-carboxylase] ligase